ncbi:MAG: ABC transporter permease subunit [Pseudomonadales bacterium]|nr:ABC transporter permease subunit [Pseudomonadales bacterium]
MSIQAPSFIQSVGIIIQQEFQRLFFSRQGGLYLFAFIFFWALMLRYVIVNVSNFLAQQGAQTDWSDTVFSTYFNISLYLFPLLCIFIAANQTGADRERGTLRLLLMRTSRDVIFFGRFLAQVCIQYCLILFTATSTLLLGFYYQGFNLSAVSNAFIMASNIALVLLPFIALMALLSASFKSSKQATISAALIWSMASGIITGISHYFPAVEPLKMLIPGMQFSSLSLLEGVEMFSMAYIPLLQTAALLIAGRFIMHRSSV